MNGREIAELLIGSTDTELVEVFTYFYKEYCNAYGWNGDDITAGDVKTLDTEKLGNRLAHMLDEIINDPEVDSGAWFKQEV